MTQQEINTQFDFRGLILWPEIKKKNTNTSGSIERDGVYRGYFNNFPTIEICGVLKRLIFLSQEVSGERQGSRNGVAK